MNWLRSKRGFTIAGVIVLLGLFLIRPGANRLRTRIVGSISLALGRPVDVGYVRLRLLPRPGFELDNFVVHDDPAFGAEAMLRADEVSAWVSLRSLIRGRIEIARLNLTEPSLNLVRNAQGHWNLESILERSAQIQVAPTSQSGAEKRPAFPYIEASRGRINFKFGAEKKPYSLTDADFSLWQGSENTWGTRLRAQPVRTDFNLTDTGSIRIDGTWQRASNLLDTPLAFTMRWERGQLGQLTKLAYGDDRGWRGNLTLAATLAGTPANLTVKTDLSAGDFHRYDILAGGQLRLAVQCRGHYSSLDKSLSDISCHAPGPEGAISVAGMIGDPLESRNYDLAVLVQGMPVQSVVDFARHISRSAPDEVTTSGQVDAKLRLQRGAPESGTRIRWTGSGEISDLHLVSRRPGGEVDLHSVPFALVSEGSQGKIISAARAQFPGSAPPADPHLEIGPFRVALGRLTPLLVHGWLARAGYSFQLQGEAQIQRLLQAAHDIDIPAPNVSAEGVGRFDLQIAGDWSGQTLPLATGKVQLHSVRAQMRNWNAPLEITSADLDLLRDEIDVRNFTASAAGTGWHGALAIPRPCGMARTCPLHFDLHADEIALDRLNQLLNPAFSRRPWYGFLSSSETSPGYLLTANASGKLTANRLALHGLTATRFSSNVELKGGLLVLSKMRAEVLGGQHTGEWRADFSSTPPQYTGSGSLERVSLRQLSAAMGDGWITGSANATYKGSTSGVSASELYSSASSVLRVEAWEGALPHIMLAETASPLQIRHLTAAMMLQHEKFEIKNGQLDTPEGVYQFSGTASLGRALNLTLTREGAPGFTITGTLAEPRVSELSASETRAALKP